jgi:glutamate/tyrosine decarboxylase-like PLP-dependent enzyme
MDKTLLLNAAQRSLHYLDGLAKRSVAPDSRATQRLVELNEPLPQGSMEAREVLHLLDERCSPATMAMAGPRFFGFVIGGSFPVALGASWLASAWDQNSALYRVTPATAYLEQLSLRWLLEMFDLPPESGGAFVTGATVANFTALAAARHRVYANEGWDIEALGLIGAPPISVIVGEEAHPSLIKSLGLLGLGRNRAIRVPVDSQGRMRAEKIGRVKKPTIICVQAGNVNTGSFDPIEEICAKAQEAGAWVHVDGAFGLWAAASPALRHVSRGIQQADSWATDAHKWLNVPYDSGLAFVRDREALRAAMAITADYLPTETAERNPSDYVPELSRRARGVEIWAVLKSLGSSGVARLIERACAHARSFADGLRVAGYDILNDVVLNQVLVSFGDAQTTLKVIDEIQREGTCWCGGTVWQGQTAMRISVSSWATTEEDVELSLAAMIRCARHHTK